MTTTYGSSTYGSSLYGDVPDYRLATYAFEVIWNPGGSTVYDTLPASNGPIRCTIQRGRSSDLAAMTMGTMTLVIQDRAGVYNPANAASPLVVAGYLRPMRRGQVSVAPVGSSTFTPIFTGYLTRVWADPSATVRQATFEFVDGFKILDRAFPVIAATGPIRAGAAMDLLVTAAGITAPADKALDPGRWLPDFSADGTASALAGIAAIALIDQGVFYIAADGVVTYKDRDARVGRARGLPVDVLSADTVGGQIPGFDTQTIVNQQGVQAQRTVVTVNTDGTVSTSTVDMGTLQTANDTSYLGWPQAGGTIQSVYLRDEIQANSLAQHVVATRKLGDVQTRDATLPGLTSALLAQQVALEISSPVTLVGLGVADPTPTSGALYDTALYDTTLYGTGTGEPTEGLIESIRHEISRQQHTTAYTLTSRLGYGFTIGYSAVGGSDLVAY
jgi:hypothetical protein